MAETKVINIETVTFSVELGKSGSKGLPFNYKGNNYIAKDLVEMKIPDGPWVDAVVYIPTDLTMNLTYVRELTDFLKKFKPGKFIATTTNI